MGAILQQEHKTHYPEQITKSAVQDGVSYLIRRFEQNLHACIDAMHAHKLQGYGQRHGLCIPEICLGT
jgi:hypothetical protein